jgi:2-iminobutanoate/2-iminopropanoate deaminase
LLIIAGACIVFISAKSPIFTKSTPENSSLIYSKQLDNLPFSKAVRAGDLVYLSGNIGISKDGKLAPGFDAQAKLAMDNINEVLHEQGLTMNNVVKCTVMIKDMSNWAAFNNVYRTYFKPGHYPARSAFGATALALNADLEVEAIAYDPKK